MKKIHAPRLLLAASPRQTNYAFMSIWVLLFGAMVTTGFLATGALGKTHPGSDPAFWEQACDANLHKACTTWVGILNAQCEDGHASACLTMGKVLDAGVSVPREPEAAGRGLGRACDLRERGACQAFVKFVSEGGDGALAESCDHGDAYNCFYLGTVLHLGGGLPQDNERALRVFQVSCNKGYVRACGVLGDMYLAGEGVPASPAKALANYETSCSAHWGESCAAAAMLYHRGAAGTQDEALSQKRFAEGCELGFKPACGYVDGAAPATPVSQ
jgi:TPR repeat protein